MAPARNSPTTSRFRRRIWGFDERNVPLSSAVAYGSPRARGRRIVLCVRYRYKFSNSHDNSSAHPRSRGAMRPSCACILRLRDQRAQGMRGARCARSLACKIKKHTSKVTTVTPVSPGIPRAMVLTVSFVLSLVTGLSCHHRKRDAKHRRQLERQRRGVRTTRLLRPPHARSSFCAKASTASHTQRP